jgi:hypothetical protein
MIRERFQLAQIGCKRLFAELTEKTGEYRRIQENTGEYRPSNPWREAGEILARFFLSIFRRSYSSSQRCISDRGTESTVFSALSKFAYSEDIFGLDFILPHDNPELRVEGYA